MAAKLALMLVATPLLLFLSWQAVADFIAGVLTDARVPVTREDLALATARFPASAQLHARLAGVELAETLDHDQAAASALTHAQQAVRLSPGDYQNWMLLASAREAAAEMDGAVEALRTAIGLAPRYAETHWQLANTLVRADRVSEVIPVFERAVALDATRLPATLDLVFNLTDGDLPGLEQVTGQGARARMILAGFLLEQNRPDDAVRIANQLDPRALRDLPETSSFLSALLTREHFAAARRLWSALTGAGEPQPLLSNGGFESEILPGLNQFDWQFRESEYAWIGVTREGGRTGARALRIDFAGRDSTRLNDEIRQMILVQAGTRYRLGGYVRTIGLETPAGPRLVVTGRQEEIAASAPIPAGDQDWSQVTVDFTAPADTPLIYVTLRRAPRFSYDKPTSGSVLMDDFTLQPLDQARPGR
ncbi:MAG: hypothetical protein ACKV2V_10365 [Blastocatellia bacterium]